LLQDAPLTFREFMTGEVPLAVVFREVYEFLRGRKDAVLFGAHAVNAYTSTSRMTEDVDVLSTRAALLAEEIRARLHEQLHVAVRVREMKGGQGYRVYQVCKPKNRHLVDVRQVSAFPQSTVDHGVRVVEPVELIAMKVMSYASRAAQPKGDTDRADIRRLLLAFPKLKDARGEVSARLKRGGADSRTMALWNEFATAPIERDSDEY